MSALDFPIAIFAGTEDLIAESKDVEWTSYELRHTTVFYSMIPDLGHMSFAIANNMSYFTKDVMSIVNHYNSKCDPSTADSNFIIGNEKCSS